MSGSLFLFPLPTAAEALLTAFCVAFTAPTFRRALVLLVGAILAKGRRTVTAILDTVGRAAPGPPASYHRVFSRAPWSFWPPATILASFVVALAEDHSGGGPVLVAGDDTVAGRRAVGWVEARASGHTGPVRNMNRSPLVRADDPPSSAKSASTVAESAP
ncbi:MAG TPA: hypothetical protein EYH34_17385, partial [Planctomycetes bacterium]|nr:hypothetical protein [Planctomycetota bacterium]